jgi:hypothetical protein
MELYQDWDHVHNQGEDQENDGRPGDSQRLEVEESDQILFQSDSELSMVNFGGDKWLTMKMKMQSLISSISFLAISSLYLISLLLLFSRIHYLGQNFSIF